MTRKEQLELYQTVVREQRDYMTVTVKERKAADPAFDFTKDEAFQKRSDEINTLSIWLQEDSKLEEQERAFDHQVRSREDRKAGELVDERETQVRELHRYLSTGDQSMIHQRANLASNGTSTGGYLVPTFVSAQVIQDLTAMETVRKYGAEVMQINGNENVPIINDAQANFIVEANSITATDPTTGRVQLQPQLLVCRTTFSWQLANRSAANVVDQIKGSFVRGIAKKEASKFLYGTGTNEPQGLCAGGTSYPVADDVSFTSTELIGMYYALNPQYIATSTWIMSPTAAAMARTLESTNGAQLWYPNLSTGAETLFGRPVVIDANMDAIAASKQIIAFASLPDAYVIGEEVGLTVFADPYTAAATGESKLYVYKFVDGRVKKAAAAHIMLTHA